MRVKSQITAGFRGDGRPGPLVVKSDDYDFEGRSLSTTERAMVYALRDAKLLEILEEDPPAVVVPIESARARRPSPRDVAREAAAAVEVVEQVEAPAQTQRRRVKKRRVTRRA